MVQIEPFIPNQRTVMENETKISVILPVYGVEKYIEKCVDSLLSQTLDNIEFIFVDDHTKDKSIELAKRRIEGSPQASQFVFLRPEHNLGAGMARNYALQFAKGEYVAYVDSDDWIEANMFEEMYQKAKEYNSADICICQASKDFIDTNKSEILTNPQVEPGEFTDEKRSYFMTHYVSLFWTFLYRRDFLLDNNIAYPEDRSADDSFFVACAIMKAQSLSYVDKPFYHYLIRPGSICTTKDNTKYQKRLIVFEKLLAFAKESGTYAKFKEEVDFIYIKKGYISSLFNYAINNSELATDKIEKITAEFERLIPDHKTNRFVKRSLPTRLILWNAKHFPMATAKLLQIIGTKRKMAV